MSRKVKNNGITLIALIITIIVLLILAGVSISMVVGDNGVLGQAINASTATDVAETKEAIELAVIGYLDENGNYTIADVEQAVLDVGATLGEDGVTVTTAKGNEFDISDLVNGAYIPSIVASDVAENPTTYYGAVVTNYTVVDEDLQENLNDEGIQWKIFYADSSNIYLIASDYVPVENAPANSSGSTPAYSSSYPYSLYLSNVYSVYSGANDIASSLIKWNSLYLASFSTSTLTNMKCVAYLMDTSLWSGYTNMNYADYAIGGTTLEMWVASWNDMGYTELFCKYISQYGYYIGTGSSLVNYSQYVTSDYVDESGYDNTLYFPHQSSWNSCSGYFLASPTATSDPGVGYISSSGYVGACDYDKLVAGFRPLICLMSDVQLQGSVDGTYSIIE